MDIPLSIDAPCDKVWEVLIDTSLWPQWGPSVRGVVCTDKIIRFGSRGRVRTPLGFWLPFRISEFIPGKRWAWSVAGIPATGHRVERVGPKKCRLVFEVPLVAAPYGLVCRLAAERIARICSRETP